MSSISAQVIATRFRVVRNFDLLVESGIDSKQAVEIVKLHNKLAFHDVRITDDKIVIIYKTCTTVKSFDIPVAA